LERNIQGPLLNNDGVNYPLYKKQWQDLEKECIQEVLSNFPFPNGAY